jgi:hypothetical protein
MLRDRLAMIVAMLLVASVTARALASPAAGGVGNLVAVPCAGQCDCAGDCDRDRRVEIGELVTGVNIAFGIRSLDACPSFDADGSGTVDIAEVVAAVGDAMIGCNHLAPDADASVGGVIDVDSVDIPPGVTVTAEGDVVIRSRGSVTIAGTIQGETVEGRGTSVTIESGGRIDVSGEVIAGTGFTAGDVSGDQEAVGADGGHGGSVTLRAKSDIVLEAGARLAAGDGGDGGSAFAASLDPDAMVAASGGSGGTGGDVTIETEGVIRFAPSSEPVLILGNGGRGGDAETVVMEEGTGLGVPRGGAGGPSGFPHFVAEGLDGLTFDEFHDVLIEGPVEEALKGRITLWVLTGDSENLIGGGIGGGAGDSISSVVEAPAASVPGALAGGAGGSCVPATAVDGPSDMRTGNAGGDGWFGGGNGQFVWTQGRSGKGSGKGGDAVAEGGRGGNASGIGVSKLFGLDIGLTAGWDVFGGNGGRAQAQAGHGGAAGGPGGNATAKGGDGGQVPRFASPVNVALGAFTGGAGGLGQAFGGRAGSALADCCSPASPGLTGGNSGGAMASGGNGGDGNRPGRGGNAEAETADAGPGGAGSPGGLGGVAGLARADVGADGSGFFSPDQVPVRIVRQGADGPDGEMCLARVWRLRGAPQSTSDRRDTTSGGLAGSFDQCDAVSGGAVWQHRHVVNGEIQTDVTLLGEWAQPPAVATPGERVELNLSIRVLGVGAPIATVLFVNATSDRPQVRGDGSSSGTARFFFRGSPSPLEESPTFDIVARLTSTAANLDCKTTWTYEWVP